MPGKPTGWKLDLTAGATVERETSVVFSGVYSLKYTNPDNATAGGWHGVQVEDPMLGVFCLPLRIGQTYHVRVASRVTLVGQGQQYRVRIVHNVAGTLVSEKRFQYSAANAWQTDVFTFTVPAGAEKHSTLFVEFNRNGQTASTDFFLDSFRSIEMEEVQSKDHGDVNGSATIDWNDGGGSYRRFRLTAPSNVFTFKNGRPGAYYVLEMQQDGTGNRAVAFSADVYFPSDTQPAITTTVNKSSLFGFECKSDTTGAVRYMGRSLANDYTQHDILVDMVSFDWLASQTATTEIPITGLNLKGKTPKIVFLFSAGRAGSADSNGAANAWKMFGAFTGAAARRSIASRSAHNVATTQADRTMWETACLVELGDAAVTGRLDVVSLGANAFTLVVDDQSTDDHRVIAVAIAGDTLKAEVGTFNTPAAAGNQTVTLADGTLNPAVGILFSNVHTAVDVVNGTPGWGMGWWTGTVNRYAMACGEQDADTTPSAHGYGITTECFAGTGSGAEGTLDARADFVSAAAGQFVVNWIETPGLDRKMFYAVMMNLKASALNLDTLTNTTTDIDVLPALVPRVAFFMSACRANSTADTMTVNSEWSFGAAIVPFEGASPEQAVVVAAVDDSAAVTENSKASTGHYYNAVYANEDAATAAREGRMVCTAMEPGLVRCRMDDADPAGSKVGVLVLGV